MKLIRSGVLAAIVTIFALCGAAFADPTTGFTLEPLQYILQKPWNIALSQRYSYDARTNTHHCWVFNSDQSIAQGNTTAPRTEMRFNPDYTTATTMMQFSEDLMVPAGTDNVCIFQIHVGDAQSDQYGSTAIALNVDGGALHYYQGTVLISNPYGKWFHLNVIHNTSTHMISVYINNVLMITEPENNLPGATDWYFKSGVYGQGGQSALTQAYERNVQIWSSN
jgi:Alginate lyase